MSASAAAAAAATPLSPPPKAAAAATASSSSADLAKTQSLHSSPSGGAFLPQSHSNSSFAGSSPSQAQLLGTTASDSSLASSASSSSAAHPQLVALRKIDALSERLQKEGKLLEALQCMEKSLILRGHIFGVDSVEVFNACRSVGEMCNYLGMSMLQQGLFDVTLELLKKAEVLTEKHKAIRAVTFNNLSCYYRKRGKLRTALNYARKALGIEAKLVDNVKSADTHLNVCAILSELTRHDKAIVHARIALKLLLLELFGQFDELQQQAAVESAESHEAIATGAQPSTTAPPSIESLRARLPPDRVAVLAIAYHNLACEEEFLGKSASALTSYSKAVKVVTTHLGAEHPLVASLSESLKEATKKSQAKDARLREHSKPSAKGSKPPSKLEMHAAKSAKSLHAQAQAMPDGLTSEEEPDDED